jgi:signal transduction histidine kinase
MQQLEEVVLSGTDRKHVEAVAERLAHLGGKGEGIAELMHDARNMVTALGLYCDLLEEPGVLTMPFQHYGSELKLVAAASRRLVEKLVAIESGEDFALHGADDTAFEQTGLSWTKATPSHPQPITNWKPLPATQIDDLAQELQSDRNLLSALAGPAICLTVDTSGAELPVRMSGEDLTRMLVNLVKNSVEAMPAGGRIHLTLRQSPTEPGADQWLTLNVEDNGPGIDTDALERIFEPGHTTRTKAGAAGSKSIWKGENRGLGLSITRSIVEAAGGRIQAANRDPSGACFQIELPVRKG